MNLPTDPFMLLSFVNMKLRDEYHSLDEMCASMDIDQNKLTLTLHDVGFDYISEINQFR